MPVASARKRAELPDDWISDENENSAAQRASLLDAAANPDVHVSSSTNADLRDASTVQSPENTNEPVVDVHTLQNEEDEAVSK